MKSLLAVLSALTLLTLSSVSAAPSLAEVGDIGQVVDCQGLTSLRPTSGSRWTGGSVGMPVKPGDWLRTDVRGANALKYVSRRSPQDWLTLGPGTLVEVVDAKTVRLIRGELEIGFRTSKMSVTVLTPDGQTAEFSTDSQVVRVREGEGKLVRLDHEPNWLKGFKGAVVSESMGQLVAKVDGRDTPLTIGYHKVTVDIRDQIARTTIEESFVNHTHSRLEGVFYFPLPQDASIAGFGMWIGGELVEADVVEKQRAREIYETILAREVAIPGLLEWTGGNVFKASVYPDLRPLREADPDHVHAGAPVPQRRATMAYRYALRSDLTAAPPRFERARDRRER